jgi:hypothetical protein
MEPEWLEPTDQLTDISVVASETPIPHTLRATGVTDSTNADLAKAIALHLVMKTPLLTEFPFDSSWRPQVSCGGSESNYEMSVYRKSKDNTNSDIPEQLATGRGRIYTGDNNTKVYDWHCVDEPAWKKDPSLRPDRPEASGGDTTVY